MYILEDACSVFLAHSTSLAYASISKNLISAFDFYLCTKAGCLSAKYGLQKWARFGFLSWKPKLEVNAWNMLSMIYFHTLSRLPRLEKNIFGSSNRKNELNQISVFNKGRTLYLYRGCRNTTRGPHEFSTTDFMYKNWNVKTIKI